MMETILLKAPAREAYKKMALTTTGVEFWAYYLPFYSQKTIPLVHSNTYS